MVITIKQQFNQSTLKAIYKATNDKAQVSRWYCGKLIIWNSWDTGGTPPSYNGFAVSIQDGDSTSCAEFFKNNYGEGDTFIVTGSTSPCENDGTYDILSITYSGGSLWLYTLDTVPNPCYSTINGYVVFPWKNTVDYVQNIQVRHNGTDYACKEANGPGTTVYEPGVTEGWESYWQALS